jgi:hypothetical protein
VSEKSRWESFEYIEEPVFFIIKNEVKKGIAAEDRGGAFQAFLFRVSSVFIYCSL